MSASGFESAKGFCNLLYGNKSGDGIRTEKGSATGENLFQLDGSGNIAGYFTATALDLAVEALVCTFEDE